MQATIKEKREVAKGTLFVTFDLGGEDVEFEPGQYFWVELLDPPYDDEKGPRRHITVVTSPTEKGVLGLATRIRDTAFKRSLVEMPEGAAVDVEQPKGSFALPEDTSKRYAFVAGGIGITPFRSMLRYIADKGLDYDVTLVYSNRDVESTAFLDELAGARVCRSAACRLVCTMTEDRQLGRRHADAGRRRAPRHPRRPRVLPLHDRRAAADGEVRRGLAARGGPLRRPGSVGLVQRLLAACA